MTKEAVAVGLCCVVGIVSWSYAQRPTTPLVEDDFESPYQNGQSISSPPPGSLDAGRPWSSWGAIAEHLRITTASTEIISGTKSGRFWMLPGGTATMLFNLDADTDLTDYSFVTAKIKALGSPSDIRVQLYNEFSLSGSARREFSLSEQVQTVAFPIRRSSSFSQSWVGFNFKKLSGEFQARVVIDDFSVAPFIVGDATQEGDVDFDDLTQLIANFRTTQPAAWWQGDFNDDQAVDEHDLEMLLGNYGDSYTRGTVPTNAAVVINGQGRVFTGGIEKDAVTEDVTLGGEASIMLLDDLVPQYGDTFEVVSYSAREGVFETVQGGILSPQLALAPFYDTQQNPNTLTLLATAPGDANGDLVVTIDDFGMLAGNFNQPGTWETGDFDGNGMTNLADFGLLAANFNGDFNTLMSAATELGIATIPQPGAGACLSALLMMMVRCRAERRDRRGVEPVRLGMAMTQP